VARITLEGVTKSFRVSGGLFSAQSRGKEEVAVSEELPPAPGEIVRALDNIDLVIQDGETLSVVGPSGSGKSTLLRVIAGLEQLDEGRVLYDDVDMTDVPPKDRGIGMVFQNYALYPHMDSRTNVGFFLLVRKRKREIPERVRITADIMGLGFEQLLSRKPTELSGGQQQRVAIARCISRDPKLFLMDEPLSNLDAKLRARTRVEIKRLLRRFGITTIYVTHDQTEAIALADRIAVMNHGQIEQVGTYAELYDLPVNVFVGTFLGSPPMNVLKAEIDPERELLRIGRFDVRLPSSTSVGHARPVLVGIRPEHVRVADSSSQLYMTVEVVEPLIQERAMLVHGMVVDQRFVARIDARDDLHPGDALPLAVEQERLLLFDPETSRRIYPA